MKCHDVEQLLGQKAENLPGYKSKTLSKDLLHIPSPDFVDKVFALSNRNLKVLRSLSTLYAHGRLTKTCYLSINHNELLTYPTKYDQIMFGSFKEAWNLGAVAVRATIYFGSENSSRQIVQVAEAFERAHQLGMDCILWCYTRNNRFKKEDVNYEVAADIRGQENHLGVSIQADIIKQKMPENNGGITAINFSKSDPRMYSELASDHPIDLCCYQVINCYMGRTGLINSGGESKGETDLIESVKTAVINKRAGGVGLILGRKAFQRPFEEGVKFLRTIQDVYLAKEIDLA
ncbi:class I fructose-bisphosphate aldolase [Pedobacter nutrimenti]|uniref:fructose-bisphosphate aldolase n=1 Tax=Pedobacter nutrimenti TaxID=1241337 RepID=A0A318UE61_9SPHI|nr:class I fructose-bisphosphate aldolase [Pedobacter nutrimenti]PYF74676.1 DhnA family fructose-bisphosphate aldolase class Ia [Pedobacter nutrimenti]